MSVHCDVLGAHQHGAFLLHAVSVELRRAVGLVDRAMRAEPGRVAAAGGKGPHAGNPVAAVAFDRPDLRTRTPGQHRARIVAEDRVRHRQIEIGRRHRAAAGLAQAPRGRGVGAGDGLDDMEEGDGIGLDPVRRARQQQAEQPRLMQFVEQRRRQPARALDLAGSRRHRRTDRFGTRDHAPIAGKISGSRNQRVQGHACRT